MDEQDGQDKSEKRKEKKRIGRMGKRIFYCSFLILYILSIHVNSPGFLPLPRRGRRKGRLNMDEQDGQDKSEKRRGELAGWEKGFFTVFS